MIYIKISILILLIIILLIIILTTICNKDVEMFMITNQSSIPKVIYQTYIDKSKIPPKVYDNIKKFAPNYKHIIYDDDECIRFLRDNYPPNVLDTFNALLKGAHKADLMRYCLLYKYGGVYLDIKTELLKPLDKIFVNNYLYSVIAKNKRSIYQGIIATPPANPIFKVLIDHIIVNKHITRDYLIFTREFYNQLNILCKKKVTTGFNKNKTSSINIYLYNEKCSKNIYDCYDGLDRYRLCCFVYHNKTKIIKTRYSDYPWH